MTIENVGLEEWVEMVGKMLHDKVREQGVMFSFGLSIECLTSVGVGTRGKEREKQRKRERILGSWNWNH